MDWGRQTDRQTLKWLGKSVKEKCLINLNFQFMYKRNVDASKCSASLLSVLFTSQQTVISLTPQKHFQIYGGGLFCFLTPLIKSYWEDEFNWISLIWYKVSSVSQSHAMILYLFSFGRMNLRSVWSMEGWINRLIETVLPVTFITSFYSNVNAGRFMHS